MESKFADNAESGAPRESKFADEDVVDDKPRGSRSHSECKHADGENEGGESKFAEPATGDGDDAPADETQMTLASSIFGDDLIIAKLIDFWGQALSDDIDTFFAEYCSEFDDDSENKLVYTKIHKKYERIMEKHLQNFRKQEGISEAEFYKRVRKATDQSELSQMIIELVLSCADFECFVDIMRSKRQHLESSSERFEEIIDDADRAAAEAKC
ncbi:ADP-ribosylation factor-like protein 2-binding protein [Hondaea fermentalgiana]|uniref:Cilia- and flagella-associated protein 36 n=1 Tax=Hondaea fermentalgiana TaxID=2315210 RepID=A0A2R5GDZ4_9STRA|nr:ADP-ribosylation factor-like protein 2-binding protein [Hondaea fermentalgiana]|eukprot:GBG28785.1 ADP-ribosylation factor-like protein 2-binding protein [Hondaea fermentalgiana]